MLNEEPDKKKIGYSAADKKNSEAWEHEAKEREREKAQMAAGDERMAMMKCEQDHV